MKQDGESSALSGARPFGDPAVLPACTWRGKVNCVVDEMFVCTFVGDPTGDEPD